MNSNHSLSLLNLKPALRPSGKENTNSQILLQQSPSTTALELPKNKESKRLTNKSEIITWLRKRN